MPWVTIDGRAVGAECGAPTSLSHIPGQLLPVRLCASQQSVSSACKNGVSQAHVAITGWRLYTTSMLMSIEVVSDHQHESAVL